MSFRGGGGSGGRSTQRTILPFGLDYADIISSTQETEKPQLLLPINGDITEIESIIAKQSMNFTKLMSEGPFFTGNLDSIEITKKRNHNDSENEEEEEGGGDTENTGDRKKKKSKTNGDGSSSGSGSGSASGDGIERYSDRYKKIQKIGRTIDEHPYQPEYFPSELYSVMGITNKHDKKEFLLLSKFKSNGGLKQILSNEKLENLDEQSKLNSMKEKMLSMIDNSVNVNDDDNNNDGKTRSGDEQEIDEDDLDDEFEDEDDDDYNAEKYFDDGDDDDGGDDGGDDEAAF